MKNYEFDTTELKRLSKELHESMKYYSNDKDMDARETKLLHEYISDFTKAIVNELDKIDGKNGLIVSCQNLTQEILKELKKVNATGFNLKKLKPVISRLYFKTKELVDFWEKILPKFEHSVVSLEDALERIEEVRMQISDIEQFEPFKENCTLGELRKFVQKHIQ